MLYNQDLVDLEPRYLIDHKQDRRFKDWFSHNFLILLWNPVKIQSMIWSENLLKDKPC